MGFCFVSHSQVGVGTLSPANSAQLDITSANKGLLIPRISLTGTTIQNPVTGSVINSLLVYNTATVNDVSPGFYYWQVNKWVRIMAQSDPEILTSLSYDATNNQLIYLDEKGVSNVLQLIGQVGPEGPQGPIGLTGPAGPQGIPGNDGATGPAGPAGPQGPIGLTGDVGPQGIQGVPGNDGATGPAGPQGPIGLTGPAGPQGIPGNDGAPGPQGDPGVAGPQGPIGLTGPAGPQGIPGNDGATGPQGDPGVAGPQGPIGLTGPAGPQGIPGNDGATGPQGDPGAVGATGPAGPAGPQGPIGITGATGPEGPQGGIGLIIDGTNTTVSGTGTSLDPYQINTPFPATTVSNTSLNNTLSTTVNGVVSSGVPIVNSNETSLTGSSLTTTVNGVSSTALDLAPAIAAGQTTTNLSQATATGIITYTNEQGTAQTALLRSTDPGNIIAIGTDGGSLLTAAAIPAVTSVSNASAGNTSTVTVNGIVSSGAPIVNTNETSLTGTNLITSVNNVASTPLDLTPLLVSGTTNVLESINGNLFSIVNGVATIPTPVLISAANGLNSTDGKVALGGALTTSTVINTSATNTLAIAGLQSGTPSDDIVVVNSSGILRTISPTSIGVTSVSNNSIANSLTTTVNGINGTAVTIINSNTASLSGANLTTTVNGVDSNVLDLTPAIAAGQITTNLGQDAGTGIITYTNEEGTAQTALLRSANPGNIIAIGSDGGTLLTAAEIAGATSVSNASAGNTATVTVNGVTSLGAPIVNSNATSLTGSSLTTTVNGVASTALNLTPAIAAATTNTLTATNGNLISTVNGVATTPAVPVLLTANNGLNTANGNVQLGGPLLNRTVITTDPSNTLVIDGLQPGFGFEDVVVVDPDGTLRRAPAKQNDFFYWRTEGNFGIDPDRNFLGTLENVDLVFRRNNIISGRLALTNTSFGVNALPNSSAGSENVAIGSSALLNNTTGVRNTALGFSALTGNTTGTQNIGVGYFALNSNTTGRFNTAFGNSALESLVTGDGNTAIGYSAGTGTLSGEQNTLIGAAAASADGITFATAIGAGAYVAASNSLVLGGPNTSVGIGTDSPTNTFHVKPSGGIDPIRVEGLLLGLATDNIVVADINGVFKTISASELVPPPVVSNTSLDNNLSTTVNGVTGTAVPIINTNELQLNGGELMSLVNGVPSPSVPVLTKAVNGLTSDPFQGGVVELGGPLDHQTEIMTNGQPLMISGLPAGLPTDNIIVTDPGGTLRTVPRTTAFSAKEEITIGATVTPPLKATARENDFIRYRELGNNEVEVDFLYSAVNPAGADPGSGDYLFTLPNAYQFNLGEHPIYTGITNGNSYPLQYAVRDVITVYISSDIFGSNTGFIMPYSPTQFRILGLNSGSAIGGIFALNNPDITISGRFIFEKQ